MKNLKGNISSSTRTIALKLGKWRSTTHKTKWPLNEVVTWQIKKFKIENCPVGNKRKIHFFNHIVLIRNSKNFLQIHNSLKIYRGVFCHGKEEWCKNLKGTDLSVQNRQEGLDEFCLTQALTLFVLLKMTRRICQIFVHRLKNINFILESKIAELNKTENSKQPDRSDAVSKFILSWK